MREYVFSYVDELKCIRYKDGKRRIFYGDEAIELLTNKDRINFRKVQIKNNELILLSSKSKLIIKNLDKMLENDILGYFYHNLDKINKAFVKQNKNKIIFKGAIFGVISVGALASIFIALNTGRLKDYSSSNNLTTEIEEDNDDIIDYEMTETESIVDEYYKANENILESSTDKLGMHLENEENEEVLEETNEYEEMMEELDNTNVVRLAFDTEIDQEKALNVYENYIDVINERAPRWGVSPTLGRAMTTQESGGYSTNLMQIQFKAWADEPITLYNYEKGQYETILLTNHPENYVREPNTQYITEKDLENPKTNISIGCILLQYSFEKMQHNIAAAIQCYNFGTKNMNIVLDATAYATGLSVDEILSDQNNLTWLEYRNVIPGKDGEYGDREYLEHVFRFIPEDKLDDIYINYIDENGEVNQVNIIVQNSNLSL